MDVLVLVGSALFYESRPLFLTVFGFFFLCLSNIFVLADARSCFAPGRDLLYYSLQVFLTIAPDVPAFFDASGCAPCSGVDGFHREIAFF